MNASLRERLDSALLYLCTDARQGQGDLADFLDAALSGGVDIVQLRDKTLETRQELECLETVREACDRHGALLSVNDRADIARAVRADVLHLGQNDLPVPHAREIIGPGPLIGRSNNAPEMAAASAVEEGVDYFCVGPAWATPTKPGRPAAGLSVVEHAAGLGTDRPWFAIGGIDLSNLGQVLDAGARRVVVVRAITLAEDPRAAAAEFKRRLVAAGERGAGTASGGVGPVS
ncbi:thiamine-phosphate pyrophosphorylase [Spinactinospora alkalitolerans]|uniref:Thiamine-phosphate synthase n=1 Tax=Spinactinospora alkalitolerans TaxID=687207 RepID=A0A852TZE6_9ACTN|nr:thiamine phosphate synthase [Spinactinospora alkalitolerans]NYE48705.1 thiamine-phosphate pyrophosphorylase [Spinactinospora alkalitolerans]